MTNTSQLSVVWLLKLLPTGRQETDAPSRAWKGGDELLLNLFRAIGTSAGVLFCKPMQPRGDNLLAKRVKMSRVLGNHCHLFLALSEEYPGTNLEKPTLLRILL